MANSRRCVRSCIGELGVRLVVDNAQRAERMSGRTSQRRAGVEPNGAGGHQRIVVKALVQRCVSTTITSSWLMACAQKETSREGL